MERERSEKAPPRRLIWLNLIWAMPLSLGSTYPLFLWSAIEWCGIYGCAASANDLDKQPAISVVIAIVAGAISALPLIVIPWTRNERRRSVIAVAYALLYVVVIVGSRLLDPDYWR